jgi:DNA processing protein
MACPTCQRRSALLAALVPAISRLSFTRYGLLDMLALSNEQLLVAAKAEDPGGLTRRLELSSPCESVPTALCRHDTDYPLALAQLPSAPAVLYASCPTERLRQLLSAPTVAIVGSRTPTRYAEQITSELAHELAAAGVTLVSGMNTGLEGSVHESALKTTSPNNIAVMPGGPDVPFPNEYASLQREILARGAAVSELPPGFRPHPWTFIASQRMIAALAKVIVVVEAGHSCALLTARIAADLGAEVGVVPGRLSDPGGNWLFALLRDGAHPISCAEDVLEVIDAGRHMRAAAA